MSITQQDVEAAHIEACKYNEFVRVGYHLWTDTCSIEIFWPGKDGVQVETITEQASFADTADMLMQIAG